MGNSAGGVFLPNEPPPSTGQVLTSPTIAGATLTTATLTAPTVTAPVISGAATLASGATLTTPTVLMTTAAVTATGATGTDAAALSTVTPAFVVTTGATDAGVALPGGATGVVGAVYCIVNGSTTGAVKVYAVGGTINGTTGTTAVSLTHTGNKTAWAFCYSAGAWRLNGNT